MSERQVEGIPVARLAGYLCAGCGVTGGHSADCPSLQRDDLVATLMARIRELEAQIDQAGDAFDRVVAEFAAEFYGADPERWEREFDIGRGEVFVSYGGDDALCDLSDLLARGEG